LLFTATEFEYRLSRPATLNDVWAAQKIGALPEKSLKCFCKQISVNPQDLTDVSDDPFFGQSLWRE
jgi:hypothetical protein